MSFIRNLIIVCLLCAKGSLNEKITCREYSDNLFEEMNSELELFNRVSAELEWRFSTKTSTEVSEKRADIAQLKATWKNRWCMKLQLSENSESPLIKKTIQMLCKGPKYTPRIAKKLTYINDQLSTMYSKIKICSNFGEEKCYCGESDVAKLMSRSSFNILIEVPISNFLNYVYMNETELLWAWTSWRNEIKNARNLFTKSVILQNFAARRGGYTDMGEYWRDEFEIPDLEDFFEQTYKKIQPLYILLHALVRFRLSEIYPEIVDVRAPIPAHLLGNIWSQNWEPLIDLLLPNSLVSALNLTKIMEYKNYTVTRMIKEAEEFYVSLGFPAMTKNFWSKSIFEKQKDSTESNCHATAANMYNKEDFRILACLDVNENDLHVVYHELGHIQYYMAYQHQPAIFRYGINSAFHEAIGDAVTNGVNSLKHMQRLDLIDDLKIHKPSKSQTTLEIAFLLKQALIKLPEIPFALIMEKWRWSVFDGRTTPSEYNSFWWKLYQTYMGIVPPSSRPETFFDPAAKFHIIHNIPYARYFLASIFQVQLFQGMCEASVTGKIGKGPFDLPLHNCDIYGSHNAGKSLRSLMKLGNNMDWRSALRIATGSSTYLVEPLLRYYEPLRRWLENEIEFHRVPIGWD